MAVAVVVVRVERAGAEKPLRLAGGARVLTAAVKTVLIPAGHRETHDFQLERSDSPVWVCWVRRANSPSFTPFFFF